MATVYSALLGAGNSTAPGSVTFYTVPANYIAIVRSIELTCYSGAPGQCYITTDEPALLFCADAGADFESFHLDCRSVLNAGTKLSFDNQSGDWTFRVSGYVLSTP